jgi:hypothetical protein
MFWAVNSKDSRYAKVAATRRFNSLCPEFHFVALYR